MKCISRQEMLVLGLVRDVALLGVLEGRGHVVRCEELGLMRSSWLWPCTLRLINVTMIVVRPMILTDTVLRHILKARTSSRSPQHFQLSELTRSRYFGRN